MTCTLMTTTTRWWHTFNDDTRPDDDTCEIFHISLHTPFFCQVNELQSKIKTVTRRMMSMVSELSMHQAEGVKLQQEVRERESELEMCYRRMEKGEPPNVSIEREWLCLVRDTESKARDKDIARQVGTAAEQVIWWSSLVVMLHVVQIYVSSIITDVTVFLHVVPSMF